MAVVIVIGCWGAALTVGTVAWARIAHTPRHPSEAERVTAARERTGLATDDFVDHVEAELKDYGAIIADLYDTTPGDR